MEQAQTDYMESLLSEDSDRPSFQITDDGKAQWAVRKIREADKNKALFERHYQEQLRKVQEGLDRDIAYFTRLLEDYFDTCPQHVTKTQAKYQLPDAELIRKAVPPTYVRDDDALVAFLKASNRTAFVKVVEKPDWAEYKKAIALVDGQVADAETGEIVQGVTVQPNPPVFLVKLKEES